MKFGERLQIYHRRLLRIRKMGWRDSVREEDLMTNLEHRIAGSTPWTGAYPLYGPYEGMEDNTPNGVLRGFLTPKQADRLREKRQRKKKGFIGNIFDPFPEGDVADKWDWTELYNFPRLDKKTGKAVELSVVIGALYVGPDEKRRRRRDVMPLATELRKRLTEARYRRLCLDSDQEFNRQKIEELLAKLPNDWEARSNGHYS